MEEGGRSFLLTSSWQELESAFDTIIFGLTVIPIIGLLRLILCLAPDSRLRWFKLLPTFGGRVVTLADKLQLEGSTLVASSPSYIRYSPRRKDHGAAEN